MHLLERVAIYNDVGFVKTHVDYPEPGGQSRAGRCPPRKRPVATQVSPNQSPLWTRKANSKPKPILEVPANRQLAGANPIFLDLYT